MKTKLLLSALLSFSFYLLSSQVPQGFNYQAIARDGSGNPITGQTMQVKIGILSDTIANIMVWEELFNPVKTNAFGMFNIVVGTGVKQSGSAATFSAIDWSKTPLFLRTSIYYPSSWKLMGTSKLQSVPYSMVAGNIEGAVPLLSVKGNTTTMDSALFVVRNNTGQIVFAVYNEGVRIYVDNGVAKGATKGGFAIGSFDRSKGTSQPLFVVDPDSIRAYLDNNPVKAVKGGFAIGSFDRSKSANQNFLMVSKDSIRMYIDDNLTKANTKGGFAIGSFDKSKGGNINYLNVSPDSMGRIYPSQNRILWYPLKNALLTGKVIAENKDSVGVNSFASGYESRSKGKYSQALGYKAIARGDYSTAIGKNAVALNTNSFAFGDGAKVQNTDSYSFGAGAISSGVGSYAIGSAGRDTLGNLNGLLTSASGKYSFAIGQGSTSLGLLAFAIGSNVTASGKSSTALGYNTTASGYGSTAMGWSTVASTPYSTAMGFFTRANGNLSTAMGEETVASGVVSTAMGEETVASGVLSTAMGFYTKAIGNWSTAMGEQNTASGDYSTALGSQNTASGLISTAMGSQNTASGYASTVMGEYSHANGNTSTAMGSSTASGKFSTSLGSGTIASGDNSTAMGASTNASGNASIATGAATNATGDNSTAMGNNTSAPSYCETVLGSSNTSYTVGSATGWNPSDRLFVIGNGNGTPSNAVTVLKNGKVGIGISNPLVSLEVKGSTKSVTYTGVNPGAAQFQSWTDGSAQGLIAGYSFYPTFQGYTDNGPRRAADILCGFSGGAWGHEFLSFNVGNNGTANDGQNITSEKMRITGNGNIGIGTTTPGTYKLYVNGSAYSTGGWAGSDIRWKKNINPLEIEMTKILQLQSVSYEWRKDEFPSINFDSGKQIGLIAQEVEKVFPELVRTDENGYKAVSYEKLSVVLLAGMKEQQKQIEGQQQQIKSTKQENQQLRTELDELKTLVNSLVANQTGQGNK